LETGMQTENVAGDRFTVDSSRCTGCLNCQLICSITYEDAFNPDMSRLSVDRARGKTRAIEFKDDCTTCGLCAKHCMYGALVFDRGS
jgi:carbon-monoxide dehydrogenase iron sulfur subunit